MARYAIGDIQGCHAELGALLALIGFDAGRDHLWLVGDLVNRGPGSLAVLRDVMAMGDAATTVLGNHDFHLLTIAAGHRKPHRGDTLDAILAAPDRAQLIGWLLRRPLCVQQGDDVLVHAGLLPAWSAAHAVQLSREVEATLQGPDCVRFLSVLYGDEPSTWRDALAGDDRLRAIVNAFTRMRFCTADGTMELREKRGPLFTPEGFAPWFLQPARASAAQRVVCGHWSTLGLAITPNMLMLDSGCLWGGALTAVDLDSRQLFQVPSMSPLAPSPQQRS
ncbi:MAG: symmetrical bis(5'-nucleosyl)-tetraphosphatase [Casimicrobiaceae bacterium]